MMNSTEYAAGQPVILHKMGGVGGRRDVSIPSPQVVDMHCSR